MPNSTRFTKIEVETRVKVSVPKHGEHTGCVKRIFNNGLVPLYEIQLDRMLEPYYAYEREIRVV